MTPIRACLLLSSLAAAGVAQAQSAAPKDDSSLTWNGITLYGIVDVGLQYQTHGVPISDYFPAGTESIIQKNSNASVTGLTPSNLSQSRIGLSGLEPLSFQDVSFVFRLETFFNPQSGNISDALKSLVLNNGRPLTQQSTNVDTQCRRAALCRGRLCGLQLPDLRLPHLRAARDAARGRDLQVRPDGGRAGVLADRLLRHHRRRRGHRGPAPGSSR